MANSKGNETRYDGTGMTNKLKASYALRPETLIQMLHHAYVMGFIAAVCDVEDTDDEPIPMDRGGPRTERWVKQQADSLRSMRRRQDGTYYMPTSRNTPDVRAKPARQGSASTNTEPGASASATRATCAR